LSFQGHVHYFVVSKTGHSSLICITKGLWISKTTYVCVYVFCEPEHPILLILQFHLNIGQLEMKKKIQQKTQFFSIYHTLLLMIYLILLFFMNFATAHK
jgi:hypothetical protein